VEVAHKIIEIVQTKYLIDCSHDLARYSPILKLERKLY